MRSHVTLSLLHVTLRALAVSIQQNMDTVVTTSWASFVSCASTVPAPSALSGQGRHCLQTTAVASACLGVFVCSEAGSLVVRNSPEVSVEMRLCSCLPLPSAGTVGTQSHAWLILVLPSSNFIFTIRGRDPYLHFSKEKWRHAELK